MLPRLDTTSMHPPNTLEDTPTMASTITQATVRLDPSVAAKMTRRKRLVTVPTTAERVKEDAQAQDPTSIAVVADNQEEQPQVGRPRGVPVQLVAGATAAWHEGGLYPSY